MPLSLWLTLWRSFRSDASKSHQERQEMCMALWAEQGREAFCSQGRNTGNMSRAACLRFLFSTKKKLSNCVLSYFPFLLLEYNWLTILDWFQLCNIGIRSFYRLYSKVLIKCWLHSLCCTIYPCSLFILYIVVSISQSPPIYHLALPSILSPSPLVTTSLFSISVNLFLFCYIYY